MVSQSHLQFAACSSRLDGSLWLFVHCPPFLYFHYFTGIKGLNYFRMVSIPRTIICYFRKIEFLEQCAVQRFSRKKGDLHVVKDNDLLFFGTTKERLAEATHCLFSFCVNFFPVTTVSSAPSRNFFKRDSDEISILQIKRANTLVNITYRYLRYIIISKYMYYSTYQ